MFNNGEMSTHRMEISFLCNCGPILSLYTADRTNSSLNFFIWMGCKLGLAGRFFGCFPFLLFLYYLYTLGCLFRWFFALI